MTIAEQVAIARDPMATWDQLQALDNYTEIWRAKLANPNIPREVLMSQAPWHPDTITGVFENPAWELWLLEDPGMASYDLKMVRYHAEVAWKIGISSLSIPGYMREILGVD